LRQEIFDDCLNEWSHSVGNKKFWPILAEKWGYESGEILRSSFKRARRKKGISKNNVERIINQPKICVFDTEFSSMIVSAFQLWEQNITPDKIIKDSFMLCWSAKIINDDEIYSDVLTGEEAKDGNDYRIVCSIWNLLSSSEIWVGQNIRGYDLKKLNTRFLFHGLVPLPKRQIVDTYLVAKSNFAFPSNGLAYINKFLGIKQKLETEGYSLWDSCMNGDEEALKKMDFYCRGDSVATTELYFKLLPFIAGHPNLALYAENNEKTCRNCGSTNIVELGYEYTPQGKFRSIRCVDCGYTGHLKQNELSKEKKKNLII
jgi:hypothetical protein